MAGSTSDRAIGLLYSAQSGMLDDMNYGIATASGLRNACFLKQDRVVIFQDVLDLDFVVLGCR